MFEFSRVTGTILAAPELLWPILTDFAHPQRLTKSIEFCQATGDGVGDVRTVRARGRVIHERLEERDCAALRFRYRALDTGDMPMDAIRSYLATVTLHRQSNTITVVEWRSEGEFVGALGEISAHFDRLYAEAIANLRQDSRQAVIGTK